MDVNSGLESLFQYVCEYKFEDFSEMFGELERGSPREKIWEAYLMRAQIKLYAADDTILTDLEKIDGIDGSPKFPRLSGIWPADAPNRFNVFSQSPNALRLYLQSLPLVRQKFVQWYGEQGDLTVRQLQCEIHYFLGEIQEALAVSEERRSPKSGSPTDAILAQSLRFRCYLALRDPRQAEECMLDMIRLSKAYPECLATYKALRSWANLTTNWSGDTPRFYDDPSGRRMPVLEDRLEGIRMGYSKTTPSEEPFLKYAEQSYDNAYTVRQYYMDLFHAMYWFQGGDLKQAESYFTKLCRIALESGLYMPLVECGEQITPLLRYVKDSDWACPRQWLEKIIPQAERYEKSLQAYQAADN